MQARAQQGFALVSVLITLVALTALATGGFLISNSDYQVAQNHTAGSRAFQTADAAAHHHLGANRRGNNSVNYTYASGNATVSGGPLLDLGDGNTLHRLTSVATHNPAEGGTAGRQISLVAMMHNGNFKAKAAITAPTGLHKNGNSGALDGNDLATASDCTAGPQPPVAGVATFPGGYTQNGAQPVPDGAPPVDDSQSGLAHLQDLNIDWAGIVNGTFITPDFTIPGDAWPNFGTIDPEWWPVIYLDQAHASIDQTNSGRGTIIAKNDLTLNGSFTWDGIILVGGVMVSDGKQTVDGTTVTALNMLLGQSVGQSSIGNGNKEFSYHSCNVRYAAQQFIGGLVYMPGSWSEGM